MPFYVDQVEASVTEKPRANDTGVHGLSAEQFLALVDAVAESIEERQAGEKALKADSMVTGQNRPSPAGD